MTLHLLAHYRQLAVAAALLSLLLSLWALSQDSVINFDGILYVEAAEHFARGDWAAGFAVYKWPFYSIVISSVSLVTGIAEGQAAYAVNALLYVLIVLGFIAFVGVLGGTGRILWLAAAVALLHPDLNAFRSFVIRDVGYWACYLWSLVFYFAYIRSGRPGLLISGAVVAVAAFLFRIEGIVLLTILPACLYASRNGANVRTVSVLLLAALATGAAVAAAPLWHYVSQVNVPTQSLVGNPLHFVADSWSLIVVGVADRLAGLQRELPGVTSMTAAAAIYLATALAMALLELVKTIGVVFSGLVIYALYRNRTYIPAEMRSWWWLLVAIQAALVLQFVVSNFFLAKRYPVALALTLLPIVPFLLDDIWKRCESRGRKYAWRVLIIGALVVLQGLEGLDVGSRKHYLKDAGLWLRANAPPGSSIYSNDRRLVYYSGLEKGKPNAEHSWHEAMQEVWTDTWRDYDYFALAMPRTQRQHEVLLFRRLEAEPVMTFSNDRGDQVLIFRPE